MGLESGTYISDLVSSNPAGTDFESQGDDHLRLLKSVLQTTLPNASRIFRFFDTKAVQTSTYSISETGDLHRLVPFDATSGALTANLPATTIDGWWCLVMKTDSSANAITLDPSGAGTINGASTITLTKQYQVALVWWNNQASVWVGAYLVPGIPYYSGGQDIPFSDIAPSANAKKILGAATATDFSEQDIVTILEWLGTAARGDIILRGASAFAYKNLGAASKILQSDGTDLVYNYPTIIQRVYSEYATAATLSTTIPFDDTIPQSGEGTEILTASITPKSASNRVRVTFSGMVTSNGSTISQKGIVALFQDSVADAIFAKAVNVSEGSGTSNTVVNAILTPLDFVFEYLPATTSAITLKIRVGANTGTVGLNGSAVATRVFGGVAKATLVLEEIAA